MVTLAEGPEPRRKRTETVLAANIKRLRERSGMSRYSLAARLSADGESVDSTQIRRMEDGSRRIRFSEAEAIASAVGVDVQDLLVPPELADYEELVKVLDARDEAWHDMLVAWGALHDAHTRLNAIVPTVPEETLRAAIDGWLIPKHAHLEDPELAREIWFRRLRTGWIMPEVESLLVMTEDEDAQDFGADDE